jgi:putative glutamine amidotransferase
MSHAHPLIGLTTYGRSADNRYSLPAEYLDAVRRAGGTALLVAPGEPRWERVLEVVDAFILTGGGDIDPDRYGGRRVDTNYGMDNERDHFELELARRVVGMEMPTLGICRGAQILNVAHGGTLIEHLPDETGEAVAHRAPPREPTAHCIRARPGSLVARVVGTEVFDAASWHHQAVRRVAHGFVVSASAPDGTVEALEMPGHPWLLAVQWHPELTAATDPAQQRLFDALVGQVRSGAA